MIPCSFDESNVVLDKEGDCSVLSVFTGEMVDGTPVVVSCWKLTKEELIELTRTGRIWVIMAGKSMQPIKLTTDKPFVNDDQL